MNVMRLKTGISLDSVCGMNIIGLKMGISLASVWGMNVVRLKIGTSSLEPTVMIKTNLKTPCITTASTHKLKKSNTSEIATSTYNLKQNNKAGISMTASNHAVNWNNRC